MIYRIITIALVTLLLASCSSSTEESETISTDIVFNPNTEIDNPEAKKKLPQFKFEHTDFDFGLIYEGEKVVHKYKFTNTGGSALVIADISSTCGCTIPTYSKEPVAPGEEGYIEVSFDSSGRRGLQHKAITILANTQPNRIELKFTAEIEVPN